MDSTSKYDNDTQFWEAFQHNGQRQCISSIVHRGKPTVSIHILVWTVCKCF